MAKDSVHADTRGHSQPPRTLFDLDGEAAPWFEHVLTVQEDMLKQTETFARHWVERRQEAAETGFDVLRRMGTTGMTDPAGAMQAMADWQRGSFERLNADLREWMALCTQATHLHAAAQEETTNGAAAPKKAGHGEASSSGAKGGNAPTAKGRSTSSEPKPDHPASGTPKSETTTST